MTTTIQTSGKIPPHAPSPFGQVLLYTQSKLPSSWSEAHGAFLVRHNKLPGFVDSHWNLNTGGTASSSSLSSGGGIPRHVLHFVEYVPPMDKRPLRVLQPTAPPAGGASVGGDVSDTFWLPTWGMVHIMDPAETNSTSSAMHAMAMGDEAKASFARATVSSLRELLGLAQGPWLSDGESVGTGGDSRVVVEPDPVRGISDWEVDALARRRSVENMAIAAQVLSSLSRLVETLPNLEMPDLIGDQVRARVKIVSVPTSIRVDATSHPCFTIFNLLLIPPHSRYSYLPRSPKLWMRWKRQGSLLPLGTMDPPAVQLRRPVPPQKLPSPTPQYWLS